RLANREVPGRLGTVSAPGRGISPAPRLPAVLRTYRGGGSRDGTPHRGPRRGRRSTERGRHGNPGGNGIRKNLGRSADPAKGLDKFHPCRTAVALGGRSGQVDCGAS